MNTTPTTAEEEAALYQIRAIAKQHGFGIAGIWTRQDAETIAERPLTDEEWGEIILTRSWRDMNTDELLLERCWEIVGSALSDIGVIEDPWSGMGIE